MRVIEMRKAKTVKPRRRQPPIVPHSQALARVPSPTSSPPPPTQPDLLATAVSALTTQLLALAAEGLTALTGVRLRTYYGQCKPCRLILASRFEGTRLECPNCGRPMETSTELPKRAPTVVICGYEDITRKSLNQKIREFSRQPKERQK